MKAVRYNRVLLFFAIAALAAKASIADCHTPLVLDLNNDGILTTGFEHPVLFDLDGDGDLEESAWTFWQSEEALLVLDLNHNGSIDGGQELFGTGTLLPTGGRAANGFEALAIYDTAEMGGNGDGRISTADGIWEFLRLWVDSDHDGRSQRTELRTMHAGGIVELQLQYVEVHELDGAGNEHRFQGHFVMQVRGLGRVFHRLQVMDDVGFQFREPE